MKKRINITIEYDLLYRLKHKTKHIKNLSAFFEKCLENSIEKREKVLELEKTNNFKKIMSGEWDFDENGRVIV